MEHYYTPDFTMTRGSVALNRNAAVSIANNSGKVNGHSIYIRYLIVYTRGKPDEGFKG